MFCPSITTSLTSSLITIDRYADYIPVVSSITNLVNLFQKAVVIPLLNACHMQKNRYYTHLDGKSFSQCLKLIFLPIISNVITILQKLKEQTPSKKMFEIEGYYVGDAYGGPYTESAPQPPETALRPPSPLPVPTASSYVTGPASDSLTTSVVEAGDFASLAHPRPHSSPSPSRTDTEPSPAANPDVRSTESLRTIEDDPPTPTTSSPSPLPLRAPSSEEVVRTPTPPVEEAPRAESPRIEFTAGESTVGTRTRASMPPTSYLRTFTTTGAIAASPGIIAAGLIGGAVAGPIVIGAGMVGILAGAAHSAARVAFRYATKRTS
jgi:hypothetical protein